MAVSPAKVCLALCAVAVVGAGAWYLARRPAPEPGELPGNEVNIWLGRAGVIVEGDAADPIDQVLVRRGGKLLPEATTWMRNDRGLAVVFCDVASGPVDVEVKTQCRVSATRLEPTAFRSGVQLRQVGLELPEGFPADAVPDTALAFSPDSQRLAIGSASGELKVIAAVALDEPPGARGLFERRIREGVAKSLAFAAGGAVLVIGEQSLDGLVFGLDARDGHELWRLRLADELESSPPGGDSLRLYSFPAAFRLLALPDGDVLVLGLHSWRADAQTRRALSRIYRLEARTGKVRWRYPEAGPEPRNVTWLDASPDGARVACVMSVPSAGQAGAPEAPLELVALDGRTGAETGRLSFPPLAPYFTSTFSWQALALQADGQGALLGAEDGRLWALDFDARGRPAVRWRHDLGTPIQAGGLTVHCGIGWALATPGGCYVELDKNREKFGAATQSGEPADLHPEGSSIQAFEPRAAVPKLLWRYDVAARPQGLWLTGDGRWLGFAYSKREGTDERGKPTPPDYGVLMFDLVCPGTGSQKLRYRYSTDGPLNFVACFSPDGRYLAVTEGPRPGTDRQSATGTYRVLILH